MNYIKNSESGRSILEIIFVMVIVTLLSIGGLFGGKAIIINTKAQAINKHMVSMVNQRRLSMTALQNQAAKRTEKAPYDTLLTIENGTENNHPDEFWISGIFSPSDLYEKVVDLGAQTLNPDKVETESDLTNNDAVKAKFFFKKYPTSNAAVNPADPTPSSPEEPVGPEEPGIESEVPVCTTDTDCTAGTLCISGTCDGTCVSGVSCNSCPDNKPYWQDEIGCVECSDDSCGSGKYCTDDFVCASCTPPTQEICSGTPATNSYGCPTQKLITCSGTTPVCDDGQCICPLGADSCSNDGTITCKTGYYLDGDTCATCGAGYILNKDGTGCVAEQSCSASNDTCGTGYYCNTTTNKCAVNTCTIENSSPVVNGTQIGTTGCYCVAGYIVNATGDGCVAETTCTSDTDCSEGYYCNTTTNKCAVNTCTIENSSPVVNGTQIGTTGCYCVAGYIVNAAGNGCEAETTCTSDTDCSEGYYCHTTTNKCVVNTCTIENSSPVVNGTQIGTTGCYCKTGYKPTSVVVNNEEKYLCCAQGTYSTNGESCNTTCVADGSASCPTCPTDTPYWDSTNQECIATLSCATKALNASRQKTLFDYSVNLNTLTIIKKENNLVNGEINIENNLDLSGCNLIFNDPIRMDGVEITANNLTTNSSIRGWNNSKITLTGDLTSTTTSNPITGASLSIDVSGNVNFSGNMILEAPFIATTVGGIFTGKDLYFKGSNHLINTLNSSGEINGTIDVKITVTNNITAKEIWANVESKEGDISAEFIGVGDIIARKGNITVSGDIGFQGPGGYGGVLQAHENISADSINLESGSIFAGKDLTVNIVGTTAYINTSCNFPALDGGRTYCSKEKKYVYYAPYSVCPNTLTICGNISLSDELNFYAGTLNVGGKILGGNVHVYDNSNISTAGPLTYTQDVFTSRENETYCNTYNGKTTYDLEENITKQITSPINNCANISWCVENGYCN